MPRLAELPVSAPKKPSAMPLQWTPVAPTPAAALVFLLLPHAPKITAAVRARAPTRQSRLVAWDMILPLPLGAGGRKHMTRMRDATGMRGFRCRNRTILAGPIGARMLGWEPISC